MSYRRPIFIPGQTVRVRRDFTQLSPFKEGAVITFQRDGYSRYDNSFFYEFATATGELKLWLLHEDEPIELCHDFFESVEISN